MLAFIFARNAFPPKIFSNARNSYKTAVYFCHGRGGYPFLWAIQVCASTMAGINFGHFDLK